MNLPDSDVQPVPAPSGTSRRTFIGAAGALGIGAIAFPLSPASLAAQASTATKPAGQFLGSNQDVFKEIRTGSVVNGVTYPGVPGLSGVRIYGLKPTKNPKTGAWTDHLAATWPQATRPPVPANPGPIVYSIYPVPEHVMDGSLNKALENLIGSAPAGSYLTCWHEALSLQYPSFITSNAMYQLHARMNTMCQGTNVTYGAIFGGGPPLATLLRSAPPNLGYYGLDLYGNLGITEGMARLNSFIELTRPKDTVTPGYPRLMIPECNMPVTPKIDQRPQWFTQVCQRMHQYGSHSIGVLTFWGGPGKLGGPWLPTDKATINAMNNIIKTIF